MAFVGYESFRYDNPTKAVKLSYAIQLVALKPQIEDDFEYQPKTFTDLKKFLCHAIDIA